MGSVPIQMEDNTPAFLAADIPGIFLPSTFRLQAADKNLVPDTSILFQKAAPQAPLNDTAKFGDALAAFQGPFTGPGFNQIFRPQSSVTPIPGLPKENNVLELNLTHETWSFGTKDLGNIPNRGFGNQKDLDLFGKVYTQTVIDVTDNTGERMSIDRTGKLIDAGGKTVDRTPSGNKPREIHFETGMFLNVPPTQANPKPSISRMASIPHGTTINLQSFNSSSVNGPPDFTDFAADITPSDIRRFSRNTRASQTFTDAKTARLPQNLAPFKSKGTITEALLQNPTSLLKDHNANKDIVKTVVFQLSNALQEKQFNPLRAAIKALGDTADFIKAMDNAPVPGMELDRFKNELEIASNISNIAFLDGPDSITGPNAFVAQVKATFWVSTVNYKLQVPAWKPSVKDGKPDVLRLTPKEAGAGKPFVAGTVPTFAFPADKAFGAQVVTVQAVQIQYTQTVTLNFGGESWPHVSVATVVPLEDVQVSPEKIKF